MKTKAEQNETRMGKTKMKTKEELNALKEEVETLNKKLAELTEEELEQVSGGAEIPDNESPASPYRRHAPYANE